MKNKFVLIPVNNNDLDKINDDLKDMVSIIQKHLIKVNEEYKGQVCEIDENMIPIILDELKTKIKSPKNSCDLLSELKHDIKAFENLCNIKEAIINLSDILYNTAFLSGKKAYEFIKKRMKDDIQKESLSC